MDKEGTERSSSSNSTLTSCGVRRVRWTTSAINAHGDDALLSAGSERRSTSYSKLAD